MVSEALSHLAAKIDDFSNRLRLDSADYSGDKNSLSSYQIALETLALLKEVVAQAEWSTSAELLDLIHDYGFRLMAVRPSEVVVGNMVRRVLKVVREEEDGISGAFLGGNIGDAGVGRLAREGMVLHPRPTKNPSAGKNDLRANILEALEELDSELETSIENITAQALEHIHTDEVILTAGHSRTVEQFLRKPGRSRTIKVIVAETAPHFKGHQMAAALSDAGIDVTLITDSAVFAIMSRVNKVILGTHSILADGGLQSVAGARMIAMAAKHHSVPLVVVSAMYKLSPQFFRSSDHDSFNQFLSPEKIFPLAKAGCLISPSLQIPCPLFDYVPPDLVTLFISNIGGHAPSYVYRLLMDLYHQDDYELERKRGSSS